MENKTIISCMREKLKDQWVTANEIRNRCDAGGTYARKTLNDAAERGIIEKREIVNVRVEYRVDPVNGKIKCPIEPNMPYEDSICNILEKNLEAEILIRKRLKNCRCPPGE